MRGLLALALAIAACSDQGGARPDAGPASMRSSGLKLSASVSGAVIDAVLENVSERPITVLSTVPASGRIDYDGFVVDFDARQIEFSGPRNSSVTGLIELASGESVHHQLDVVKWATLSYGPHETPMNPGGPLKPGRHTVKLIYATTPNGTAWSGTLVLEGLQIVVP